MKNLSMALVIGLIGLGLVAGSLTAFSWAAPVQSVCTMTGLTGPALQENDLYCANGTNIAPSTYPEAIMLAQKKAIVIGTPKQVSTVHDWRGVLRVDVEFSRGYHAEHYLVNPNTIPPWIYSPEGVQVWP